MPKLKKICLFAALFMAAGTLCRAESPPDAGARPNPPPAAAQDPVEQAERLFQSGEWERARQAYKSAIPAGEALNLPPALFYNYGTTLAKAGATGEAYVALLHAAFAMPFDGDTKANLRLVASRLSAGVRSIQPALWLSWWPEPIRTWPWKVWLAMALLASTGAFALWQLRDRTPSYACAALAAALLLWTGLAWSQTRLPVYGAMALAKVKSGPGPTFSDITTLEPGSLFNSDSERQGWYRIRFLRPGSSEEAVGWVDAGSVLRVQ